MNRPWLWLMAESRRLHYHRPVRETVLGYIRERDLMRAGDRVGIAVSGGADSVALLRILLELRAELGVVLLVAHFNHGLRGVDSEADEAFVAEVAREHDLEFFCRRDDVRAYARTAKLSVEAAARELRYGWLSSLAISQRLDSVATGHTLDDQAETVLLKFLRGAGTRGLAGVYPEIAIGTDHPQSPERGPETRPLQDNAPRSPRARIIRPLLGVTRSQVEQYLSSLGQAWREDETNLDPRFARNRIRHELLPLLERQYRPNIRRLLSDAAELSRAEEEYWQKVVGPELEARMSAAAILSEPTPESSLPESALGQHLTSARLQLQGFSSLPVALQRRLLKRFVEDQRIAADFEHIEKLVRTARGESLKIELPGGWLAMRLRDCLELCPPKEQRVPSLRPDYQHILPVPGEVRIAEFGLTIRALPVAEQLAKEAEQPENLLNAALLGPELTVRNWHPGDRFGPVHSKSEEKLKRLFAEKHIPAEQRSNWPVVLNGLDIVWVRGFPAARIYAWNGSGDAVVIEIVEAREVPAETDG